MNTGWDLLAKHTEEKHPNTTNFGDTAIYDEKGVLVSQRCFICGEELVPSPEEEENDG